MKNQNLFRIILILTIGMIMREKSFAQIRMSTLAAGGGTSLASGAYVSQIIGQSSIVSGTSKNGDNTFRQGFKQPLGVEKNTLKQGYLETVGETIPWSYEAFPNPFVDKLTIRFDKATLTPVKVLLYDSGGRIVWEESYPANLVEINLAKFQQIGAGRYVLQVLHKGRPKTKTLIKDAIE